MHKVDLQEKIEFEINKLAKMIVEKKANSDEIAHAKIGFYLALQRVLAGSARPGDIGLMDAVNDTLQMLGIMKPSETFISHVK